MTTSPLRLLALTLLLALSAGAAAAGAASPGDGPTLPPDPPAKPAPAPAPPVVGHALEVRLDPEAGRLTGTDRLTLAAAQRQVILWLHAGLAPKVVAGDAVLARVGRDGHLERFRLTARGAGPVTIGYGGSIRHPPTEVAEGMGRARAQSLGTISPDGVFLTGFSGWYPHVADGLERFTLTADLPPGWLAVSQGAGPVIDDQGSRVRLTWQEDQPQDEIHLNAARFRLYQAPAPDAATVADPAGTEDQRPVAQAWLRRPDDDLAERYLDATATFLDRYSALIGPYPYAKFALVENFWETGYGMPSFTLLGSSVIRLPFILHTSYPHEILHNWWGNGVFVDFATGNWSEGLTTYLADHLNAELDGRGPEYRRDQLTAWADHVGTDADFPVRAFQGRHGDASQAVGYGKAMMIFHMLRISYGDAAFVQALRGFYRDQRFRVAGWDQLRAAFAAALAAHGGRPDGLAPGSPPPAVVDLDAFFDAWIGRPGAPRLSLSDVQQTLAPSGAWQVTGRVNQLQVDAPFPLTVPLVVHTETGAARELRVAMDGRGRSVRFDIELPAAAVRVALDPRFDTFRVLFPGESPVRLGALFGADTGLIVLPAGAPPPLADGYRALAAAWTQGEPGWAVVNDRSLDTLPADRPVWLLGWENRFVGEVAAAAAGRFALDPAARTVTVGGTTHRDVSPVLTAERAPTADAGARAKAGTSAGTNAGAGAGADADAGSVPGPALGWLAAAGPAAVPALARKLPHYGRQGWLVFDADGANALVKGQWPAGDSALVLWLGDAPPAALAPPPRPSLLDAATLLGPPPG